MNTVGPSAPAIPRKVISQDINTLSSADTQLIILLVSSQASIPNHPRVNIAISGFQSGVKLIELLVS